MTLDTLEQAVQKLSAAELAQFRDWFIEFEASAWDAQIEADNAAGKLQGLMAQALADHRDGQSKAL
jgi:hypothetical protein